MSAFLKKFLSLVTFGHYGNENEVPKIIELDPHLDEIRSQMEFYFSPSNIATNQHMKMLIDQNPDRYVDVHQFMNFNKIIELKATPEEILEACAASNELEVNGEMIRTRVPFIDDPRRSYRTIFVKDLDPNETLQSLYDTFTPMFPPKILRIEMLKKVVDGERVFSGRANFELLDESMAQQAVKCGIEYHGQILKPLILAEMKSPAGRCKGKKGRPSNTKGQH